MPVRGSYLLGFVSCPVMKAWARQSILFFFILFCVYASASDRSFPVSEDYSQENCVAFLQLRAKAALRLPGHISKCLIGYKAATTYYVVGNGVCVLLQQKLIYLYIYISIAELDAWKSSV